MRPLSDRHVDRCPLCGAWRWWLTCRTPHDPRRRVSRAGIITWDRRQAAS